MQKYNFSADIQPNKSQRIKFLDIIDYVNCFAIPNFLLLLPIIFETKGK